MKSDEVRREVYKHASALIANDPGVFQALQAQGATEAQIRKAVERFQASCAKKSEYRPHAKSTPEPLA
jgi:hypothetical protein